MPGKSHPRLVPRSAAMCVITLVVGAALAVQALWSLLSGHVNVPALEYVVAVLGVAAMVFAAAGLAWPRLRGR